jgi:hypothetical protein
VKYQISSIVRCTTARATIREASVNNAIPPRGVAHKTRTSQPPGAMTSGATPMRFVSKAIDDIAQRPHQNHRPSDDRS